tara:strand:- start:53 stop:346 length:294 start_codon:yes stop_codon:yes gene_type:complete
MATTKSTNSNNLLANFIYDVLNCKPIKTKSGKGYMLYNIPEMVDIQKLTQLVTAVNPHWSVTYFEPEYDRGRKTKDASIYFGEKSNKNEIEKDEFLA